MARRVNTKFLIILTLIVVGGGVALLAAGKLFFRHTPEQSIAAGDKFMAEGNYEKAIGNYGQARAMRPGDPAILVKIGDAFEARSVTEPAFAGKERAAWLGALEVKSDYVPALERLFAMYKDDAESSQRADVFSRVADIGKRLLAAKPDDVDVRIYVQTIPIRTRLAGIVVEDKAFDDAIKALDDLRMKHPENPEPPFWVAQARLVRALDRQQSGYPAEATKLRDEAAALFASTGKEQKDNAEMRLRAFQIFTGLARGETDEARRKAFDARAKTELDAAVAVAGVDDPKYVDIHLTAAQVAQQKGDAAGAEKIIRDLAAKRPDDQPVRLTLARLLGTRNETRDEAIALLEKPVKPADRAYKTRNYELQTLVDRTGLRLDAYQAEADAAKRDAIGKSIDADMEKLTAQLGNVPAALRLQGKYALMRGNVTDAIQLLNRAVNEMATAGQSKDYDLMYLLARAYMAGQQTGQAKIILGDIVAKFPTFPAARLLLAQLLLRENAVAEAQAQLDELLKIAPDSPEVQRLRLAMLKASGNEAQLDKDYDRMPEATENDQRAKAQLAVALGKYADAARLLEAIRASSPKDAAVAKLLIQAYATLNEPEKAKAVAEQGMKDHPEDAQFALMRKSLDKTSPEELIAQDPDEFSREMRLGMLAASKNDSTGALAHLKKAETLKPDDRRVMDSLFQYYLGVRDWASAEGYLDRLAKIDADQAGGAIYRIKLAMARGRTEEAIRLARELTGTMGEFSQSWLLLGQALQAAGSYDEAAGRYAQAIEKQSENLEAYRGIIQTYYALNQPEDARRYIEQARRIFPDDASIKELQVQYELTHGDPETAVAAREQARKADADSPQTWLNLGVAYLRSAQNRAAKNQPAEAAKWLDKAKALFSEAMVKWPDEPRFYSLRAEVALAEGKFDEGLAALTALAGRDAWKDRDEPQVMLGDYYARGGKAPEAEEAYRTGLRRGGNKVEVELKLADLLSRTGKTDEAMKVLELNPDDARVLGQRIAVLMGAGRFADAEKLVNTALEKEPKNPDLIKNLAAIYINTNRKSQAMERLEQVLAENPNDIGALHYVGLIHVMNNEPDAAIKALAVVRDRNPDDVDARFQLAKAYEQKNDLDSAARELEAALSKQALNKPLRMELVNVDMALKRWRDAERLIAEARAMPIYAKDPDWPSIEAGMWARRGDYAKAVTAIQQALQLAPTETRLARAYFEILVQGGDYKRVLAETDKLVAAGQSPWWMLQYRGVALRRLDRKDEALAEFDKAMQSPEAQQNPDVATQIARTIAQEIGVDETLSRLADKIEKENRWRLFAVYLYQARNDSAQAVAMLDRVMAEYDKLTPAEQDAALRLGGLVYTGGGQLEKAYDAYLKLLKKYPNDVAALNNVACLLADNLNRPNQAVVYSERAYREMQQSGRVEPLILDTHGWCLVLNDRVDEGIGMLRQALESQAIVDGRYHLGMAYLKKKNAGEAVNQLTIAQDMIQRAEKATQPVDPALKRRIAEAMDRAKAMAKG